MNSKCLQLLKELYATNFVAYYNAHVSHFNVEGTNFVPDHELFGEVYDYLYDNHDSLGEQIRQADKPVFTAISDILKASCIDELLTTPVVDGKLLAASLNKDLEAIIKLGNELYSMAEPALETYIGDYLVGVNKLNWKLKAVLKRSVK